MVVSAAKLNTIFFMSEPRGLKSQYYVRDAPPGKELSSDSLKFGTKLL